MEISTREELNPITQDTKNGKLRFINYSAVLFNYGALPQTWEDPAEVHPDTGKPGDGDPVDVIDLSTARLERGEVTQVKVVGALALIDEGETDWKVLVINVNDKDASNIHSAYHTFGAKSPLYDAYTMSRL
jgi:inorganic pyrophosphatase